MDAEKMSRKATTGTKGRRRIFALRSASAIVGLLNMLNDANNVYTPRYI
jgi:hypothetical protein